jgi:hypothetical protein
MAHFAKLDDNNVVLDVNSVSNHELVVTKNTVDEDGNVICTIVESEDKGIAFLTSWSGGHANWKQTSYNSTFRGKFAGKGDTYDPVTNMFIGPVVKYVEVTAPVVEYVTAPVVESIEITTPDIEPVVMGESTHVIQTLTSSNVSPLSSAHIAALNTSDLQSLDTSDLQSLTTTGL